MVRRYHNPGLKEGNTHEAYGRVLTVERVLDTHVFEVRDAVGVALLLKYAKFFGESRIPNVLKLHGRRPWTADMMQVPIVGDKDGGLYSFAPGQSLERKLRGSKLSDPERADLADGYGEHGLGVWSFLTLQDEGGEPNPSKVLVHRDFKPHNVVLHATGWVTVDVPLMDTLGQVRSDLFFGKNIGSPFFMPPETRRGSKTEVDHTYDLYSLARGLEWVLSGVDPGVPGAAERLKQKIDKGSFGDRTAVARKWQAFIEKAAAEEQKARPQTIAECRDIMAA